MNKIFLIFFIFLSFFSYSQEVNFSHDAGFYDSPFFLKINNSNSKVLYSYQDDLNKRSKVFTDSILIDKTTTISFGLYQGDSLVELGSKSYFVNFKTNFKVVSISINNDYLFDHFKGIYVKGPRAYFDTLSNHYRNTNWERKWERSQFVEVFNEKGDIIISQKAGLRIFGGMTKYYPEKSLRFIARDIYGDSRFNADLFDCSIKDYKQFILRHSGNDYRKTRFKDALLTSLAAESDLDIQKSSPAHLFVNSEYWGVYNIREKVNKYYIDNNYNCGTLGIDILQGYKTVDEGSPSDYIDLLNFIKNNDLKNEQNYKYVKTKIDVRNFINFWVHQIFYANHDVRGNIRFWKSDSLDNKFRWIVYDTDLAFGPSRTNKNLLKDFTSPRKTDWYNPNWATFLLRNLLENSDFRKDFILQSSFILSTTLSTNHINTRIDEFFSIYDSEMKIHFNDRKKFQNYQGNYNKWLKSIDDLRYFAEKRDEYSFQHLEKKFSLDKSYTLKVNVSNNNGKVMINNNQLQSNNFTGKFYFNYEIPIKILAKPGYYYTGFKDTVISNFNKDTFEVNIEFKKLPPSNSKIIINEIDYVNESVELYNQEDTIVYLNGWKLIDQNSNVTNLDDLYLNKNSYLVLNYYDTIKKIDTVRYSQLSFKLSSVNEKIFLFDGEGKIVDSVVYILDTVKSSYVRNIPIDNFEGVSWRWGNSYNSTIGYHNNPYQILKKKLEERLIKDRKNKRMILYSSVGGVILVAFVFFYLK
tara:strand:- start:3333 stop:5582 length:2250 start_codon:yes stop_codon:yes gene_type:complete